MKNRFDNFSALFFFLLRRKRIKMSGHLIRQNKKKKLSPLNNDGIIKKKKIVDAKRILDSSHDPRQLKTFLQKSEKFRSFL